MLSQLLTTDSFTTAKNTANKLPIVHPVDDNQPSKNKINYFHLAIDFCYTFIILAIVIK